MRASRSAAAQHIALENVCTRCRPRYSQRPGVGTVEQLRGAFAETFQPLEGRQVAARNDAPIEEVLRRRHHDRAVDVVLNLLVRLVADPTGPMPR